MTKEQEKTEQASKLRIGKTHDNLVALDLGHDKMMAAVDPWEAVKIAMQLLVVAVNIMNEEKKGERK